MHQTWDEKLTCKLSIRLFIFTDLVILLDTEPMEENEITEETVSKRSFRISQQKQSLCRLMFHLISFHATQISVFEDFFKKTCVHSMLSEERTDFFLRPFYNPLLHSSTIKIGKERECLKINLHSHLFQTF